ncbi:hypothetical protein GC207_00550 [bacterium]|nr:hypothetical protein [bacterium]
MELAIITELFAGFVGLVALAISLLGTIFWIWMIIDCATKESSEGNDKIIWILIILFTHIIGALIYFFARRPTRIAQLGR